MSKLKRNFGTALRVSIGLTLAIWVMFLIDTYLFGGTLRFKLGLRPRDTEGLIGILTTPFFHGGWGHLLSNSFPMVTLTGLLIFFFPKRWPAIGAFLWLGTGALTWLIADLELLFSGSRGVHIGASGVVFAVAAYLSVSGFVRRNFRILALSLIVIFYYGSMFAGVLPGREGISWESHLAGAIIGVMAAFFFKNQLEDYELEARRRKERKALEAEGNQSPFLSRDTFEKTKQERKNEAFWNRLEDDLR
ncbi:MAG: rhomboid family intramembrane serine protease [Bacteroidota bacterium]